MVDQVTLEQFIENKWFKLLTRGAMIIVAGASSYIGIRLALYDARIAAVEMTVTDVSETQIDRAALADQREVADEKFEADILGDVNTVRSSLFIVQTDVATIKGILQGIERREASVAWPFAPSQK